MRRFAALALALAASGCGFHWAGSRPVPPELASIYIDVISPFQVSAPPIEAALRTRLLRRGAVVYGSAGAARDVLRLSELQETREVLSVDPYGKAVEYKLTTRVKYELLENDRVVVPADVMVVSRDYSFNAQQVLAKEAEEQRLQAYMQDELAELLLLRLEARVSRKADAPAAVPGATPAQ